MCTVLKVCRSGHYACRCRPPSTRTRADMALAERIECIHRKSRGTYGARRVHTELRLLRIRCARTRGSRDSCEKLGSWAAAAAGSVWAITRTSTAERGPAVPDLVQRYFVPEAFGRLWMADITYASSWEGWLYLTFVLDTFPARLWVGRWPTTSAPKCYSARSTWRSTIAGWLRLVHNSNRGSRYTSVGLGGRLKEAVAVRNIPTDSI